MFANHSALVGYTPAYHSHNTLTLCQWSPSTECERQTHPCVQVTADWKGQLKSTPLVAGTCITVMSVLVHEVGITDRMAWASTCYVGMWQAGSMCDAEGMSQARLHLWQRTTQAIVGGQLELHVPLSYVGWKALSTVTGFQDRSTEQVSHMTVREGELSELACKRCVKNFNMFGASNWNVH